MKLEKRNKRTRKPVIDSQRKNALDAGKFVNFSQ